MRGNRSPSLLPQAFGLDGAVGNLYMVVDGDLVRLNAATGVATVLVRAEAVLERGGAVPFGRYSGTGTSIRGNRVVVDYRVSADESQVVVLRAFESAEAMTYELLVVDAATGWTTVIAENLPRVLDMELAAGAGHIAYITVDADERATVRSLTLDGARAAILGRCQAGSGFCLGLFDEDSAETVLYSDGRGLWRARFDGNGTEHLADFAGTDVLAWTPFGTAKGRHQLLWGERVDGSLLFVFDREARTISEPEMLERIPSAILEQLQNGASVCATGGRVACE